MDIKKYFFSKDNVNRLTKKFVNMYQIEKKDDIIKCREFIADQMKNVFEKNKGILNKGHPEDKVINHLNKKSLELCTRIYDESSKKSNRSDVQNSRRPNPTKRQPSRQEREPIREYQESGNYASFGELGNAEYITADGRPGAKMVFGVDQNNFIAAGKKGDIKDHLDMEYMKRASEYDSVVGRSYANGGNNQMGYQMPGLGGGYNNRGRPPTPDFSLDGKGNKKDRDSNGMPLDENTGNFGNFEQFGNFGGNFGGNDQYNSGYNNNNLSYDPSAFGGNLPNNNPAQNYGYNPNMGPNMNTGQNYGYNPNMSPNINTGQPQQDSQMMAMMQQFMQYMAQNQNFQMGGGQGNNELHDIAQSNNDLAKSIASGIGINPQALLNMSSDEMAKMITTQSYIKSHEKQKKHRKMSHRDSDDDSENSSDDNDKSDRLQDAKSIVKSLLQIKNKNEKNKHALNEAVENTLKKMNNKKQQKNSSDDDSDKESERKYEKNTKNTLEKNHEKNQDRNQVVKPKKNVRFDNDVKQKESIIKKIVLSDPKELGYDKDSYNNYMIEFENDLKNVKEIKLKNINISLSPILDNTCNTVKVCNNKMKIIEFTDGKYTADEIIELYNQQFESFDWNIIVSIDDNRFVFENTDGETFSLDFTENSIGKHLGFDKENYDDESKYIAENVHAFNTSNIYLFVNNISKTDPFAIINEDCSFEQKIFNNETSRLPCLIIQFRKYKDSDMDKDLIEFDNTHEIEFEISMEKE